MPPSISADIEALRDACNDAERLTAALAVWRRSRCPMIARWIEVLGERTQGPAWPTTHRGAIGIAREMRRAYTAQSLPVAQSAIDAVLAAPADPRMTTWALAVFDAPPAVAVESETFWRALVNVLGRGRSADDSARLIPITDGRGVHLNEPLRDLCIHQLLRQPSPPRAPLSAADADVVLNLAVFDLLAETHEPNHARLLAHVLRAPDDPTARAMLGDYLILQGDPRGTFIQLQLAPETPENLRRQSQMLSAHLEAWLAHLGPVQQCAYARFRDGFASHLTLQGPARAHVDAVWGIEYLPTIGHLDWATVRSIRVDASPNTQARLDALLHAPARHALRQITGVCPLWYFWELLLGAPLDLTTLAAWIALPEIDHLDQDESSGLRRGPGLPRLETLWLDFEGRIADCVWFMRTPLARRLTHLNVRCPLDVLPRLPRYLDRGRLACFELHLPDRPGYLRLERIQGAWARLTIVIRRRSSLPVICAALRQLRADWLSEVCVDAPASWGADLRAPLVDALAHQIRARAIVWTPA